MKNKSEIKLIANEVKEEIGNGNSQNIEEELAALDRETWKAQITSDETIHDERIALERGIYQDQHREEFFSYNAKRILKKAAPIVLGALVAASAIFNLYLGIENGRLKKDTEMYKQSNAAINKDFRKLQTLNTDSIKVINEKIDELKQKIPVRGVFVPLEKLVGGISMFNGSPIYTERLDELVKEAAGYSRNPKEIWEDWQVRTHGIGNYIPKISWLLPPIIGDGNNTVVQQDMGENTYIMILGNGMHDGIDLTNKDSRMMYASFDSSVIADSLYEGKGRTITLQADQRDEQGYFYRISTSHLSLNSKSLKPGQKIKKGDYLGYTGNTGFVTGVHAHVEFYRSITGKPGTWKLYNPFQNNTYAPEENLVWFSLYNIPAELKEIVKQRIK